MKTARFLGLAGPLLLDLFLTGCTTKMAFVKPHSLGSPLVADRFRTPVELRLTDSFRNAQWEMHYMGKTVLPFGPHLVTNTVESTHAAFANLRVTESEVAASMSSGARALLIPRLIYVDLSGDLRKDPITMALEWTMLDSTRRLVWVGSFRSAIRTPAERVKGAKKQVQRRFDLVLEDLLKQSREAMLSSPEIRRFAKSIAASEAEK